MKSQKIEAMAEATEMPQSEETTIHHTSLEHHNTVLLILWETIIGNAL